MMHPATSALPGLKTAQLALAAAACLAAGAAVATPLTGTPAGPSDGTYLHEPWSTNADNLANGHHHVLHVETGPGYVTLDFINPTRVTAYFEYRADSEPTQYGPIYAHPTIDGDFYFYYLSVNAGASTQQTFYASQYVDIRSAFGPERDWDFDWTRFEVGPVAVPAPATLPLAVIGLLGMFGALRRRAS